MQAYWGNPANKQRIMHLVHEEHQGFPTPQLPDGRNPNDLDYEDRLGIPLPIALVAEAVYLGAPAAYADTWPGRFFDTIEVNANLSAVVWQVMERLMLLLPEPQRDWRILGEQLLALLARAPMS